mgnify:CR=1 FL=1
MSNTVISVENLTKRYDLGVIGTGTLSRDLNRWWARLRGKPDPYTRIGQRDHFERIGESILALDDVSFKVEQGEALGIIGKNGAGKSTLLKILSRVTAPTSGVVKVKGRIGSLLEVGTGFHPELTGRENVYLNGAILGMRKDEVESKFDEIVDFAGVEKFIDTPVKRYSSGMYVRLAFSVAAHLDPEILVVDEVLAVGDAEFQKKCLGKMENVAHEGRTVLFVSHNMAMIEKLCPNVLLLRNGQIDMKDNAVITINKYLSSELNSSTIHNLNNDEIKRTGSGDVKFTKIYMTSKEGEYSNQIKVGEQAGIYFEVFGLTDRRSIEIGFSIYDSNKIRISGINSRDLNNFSFDIDSGEKKIIHCIIPQQNLAHGQYYIDVMLRTLGMEVLDYIEQAYHLEIIPSNYFNTGKLPRGENVIYLHTNWLIEGNTQSIQSN